MNLERLRFQYLDLLEKSLTGTLYQDPSIDPWTAGTYDPIRRELGRDLPKNALTMIGSVRLHHLRRLCEEIILSNIVGDFVETGVWRGGACIMMAAVIKTFGDSRHVWACDSFEGLPEPRLPQDSGDMHFAYSELSVPVEEVEENFRKFDVHDRMFLIKGWFSDTLTRLADINRVRISILRLDGDMYESTIDALVPLYPRVSKGGYVIVDDYHLAPCARAINDYRAEHQIAYPLLPIDGAAVYWKV